MDQVKLKEEQLNALTAGVGTTYVQGGIKRTVLQKAQFPQGYTINFNLIEVPAGSSAAPHIHPGLNSPMCWMANLTWLPKASRTNASPLGCRTWSKIRMCTSHGY